MAVLMALSACAPPDAPSRLDFSLPDAAISFLQPDSVTEYEAHRGVVYRFLWSPRGPWAVHLVEAGVPARCDLAFEVLRAGEREMGRAGRERVSDMVRRSPLRVLAAVNADFFTPEGQTVGAEVVDGRVISAEPRPTFAWAGEEPWMGIATVTNDQLRLGWAVDRDMGDGETQAVGGFPDLIDEGIRVGDLEVGARASFAAARHPRTAVGYSSTTRRVWMVVVDGRQTPHSAGMSLPELAGLLESLGVDEAINLDGGGSTAMVVNGAVVSRPSDATGERAVVNALALTSDLDGCSR